MSSNWHVKKSARQILRRLTGAADDIRSKPSPKVRAALSRYRRDIAAILAGEALVLRTPSVGLAARARAAGGRPLRGISRAGKKTSYRFLAPVSAIGKISYDQYLTQHGYHKDYEDHSSKRMGYLDRTGKLRHATVTGRRWMVVRMWQGFVADENWEAVKGLQGVYVVDDRGIEIKLCTDPEIIKRELKKGEVSYELKPESG
jgi:hypothetical protein